MLEMLLMGASLAALPADAPVCRRETLAHAIDRYANATLVQDNAAIATMYGVDGVLVAPDKSEKLGADKVMAYLDGFNTDQVDDATMRVTSTTKADGAWQVQGSFAQAGKDAKGKGYKHAGRFTATMACVSSEDGQAWRIKRMETITGP